MKKIIGLLVVSVMLVGCGSLQVEETAPVADLAQAFAPVSPVADVAPVVIEELVVEVVETVEVPVFDEQDNVVGTETIISPTAE